MTLSEILISDIKEVFMNSNDFARDFLNARTGLTVSVIFDNEYQVIIEDVESTAPVITAADTDIPGIADDDLFTDLTTSVVYKVIGIQPEGTGMAVVILSQD